MKMHESGHQRNKGKWNSGTEVLNVHWMGDPAAFFTRPWSLCLWRVTRSGQVDYLVLCSDLIGPNTSGVFKIWIRQYIVVGLSKTRGRGVSIDISYSFIVSWSVSKRCCLLCTFWPEEPVERRRWTRGKTKHGGRQWWKAVFTTSQIQGSDLGALWILQTTGKARSGHDTYAVCKTENRFT